MKHPFFLTSGNWHGQGVIAFTESGLAYPYTTSWQIKDLKNGVITCQKQITLSEAEVVYHIAITFSDIDKRHFSVNFDNDVYGIITGKGSWKNNILHWDLFDTESIKISESNYLFDGDECYQVQNSLLLNNGEHLHFDGSLKPSNN